MRKNRYLTREASEPTRVGDESWSLVRLTTPMWDERGDTPVRLDAFVVFGHDGQLIAEKIFDPSAAGDHAAEALQQALKNPRRGKVRKPSELRVEDKTLVATLTPLLQAPVRHVKVAEEADVFFAAMRGQTVPRVPRQSFKAAGVSDRLLREFIEAMQAYERAEPFEHANADQPVGLHIPSLGLENAAITVETDRDLGIMVQEGDDPITLEGERSEREPFEHGLISAYFGRIDEQSAEMAVELQRLGVDAAHAPLPHVLGKDACARPLERRDIVLLTAAAKAIVRLLETDADVFTNESEKSVELDQAFEIDGETVQAQILAPHPLIQWMVMGDEPDFDDEVDDEPLDETVPNNGDAYKPPEPSALEKQIRDTFLGAAFARAQTEEWRMRATRVVNELFDYTNAGEARLGDWTMGELERFVLTDLPGCLDDRATIAQAPETIVAFARFLREEKVPRIDVEAIEKRMRKIRPRLDELLQARHTKLLA